MGWHKGTVRKSIEGRIKMKPIYEQILEDAVSRADELTSYWIKEVNNFIEETMRNKAQPPIKGELTLGKTRWRGIKIIIKNGGTERYVIIEQRGVPIGMYMYD